MSEIQYLIELLKSDNSKDRYDACERLTASQHLLPREAIEALRVLTGDTDPDVAEAAQRALKLHDPDQIALHTATDTETKKKIENSHSDNKQNLWQIIFVGSIVISLVSACWAFFMVIALGLGGWILEGTAVTLATIVFFYLMLIHPLLIIVCPIRSWYLQKQNKHTQSILWAITPMLGLLAATLLYRFIDL